LEIGGEDREILIGQEGKGIVKVSMNEEVNKDASPGRWEEVCKGLGDKRVKLVVGGVDQKVKASWMVRPTIPWGGNLAKVSA
jgi:hypothetical protein